MTFLFLKKFFWNMTTPSPRSRCGRKQDLTDTSVFLGTAPSAPLVQFRVLLTIKVELCPNPIKTFPLLTHQLPAFPLQPWTLRETWAIHCGACAYGLPCTDLLDQVNTLCSEGRRQRPSSPCNVCRMLTGTRLYYRELYDAGAWLSQWQLAFVVVVVVFIMTSF